MSKGSDNMAPQVEKKFVQFHRNCSPYLAGEVAMFHISPSLKLVAGVNPIGFYVKKDADGKWVPEGDKSDNIKQTDEDRPSEQEGTGQAEPGTTEETDGAAKPAKQAGQQRRQRAKL